MQQPPLVAGDYPGLGRSSGYVLAVHKGESVAGVGFVDESLGRCIAVTAKRLKTGE